MGLCSFFRSNKEIGNENQRRNVSVNLSNFRFISGNHSKYENGVKVASINDCWREIEINKNSKNDNSYSMELSTLDQQKNKWQSDVQMKIKQLRLKNVSNNKFEFRGFGDDGMGLYYSDYGITIVLENNSIAKVILKFFYRNTELHYSR